MLSISTSAGITYRTRVLPLDRAARFAKCLRGNARFLAVEIEESRRAMGEARWLVRFVPANPERIGAMIATQGDGRQHTAETAGRDLVWCHDESGRWSYCYSPRSQETYEVSPVRCDCKDFEFRSGALAGGCYHMRSRAIEVAEGRCPADQQAQDEQDPAVEHGPAGAVWTDDEVGRVIAHVERIADAIPHDNGPQHPGERRSEYVARTTPAERAAHAREDIDRTFGRAA